MGDKKETDFEMLARLMTDGFNRIEERLAGHDERFESIESKIENLQAEMHTGFARVTQEFVEVNERLDSLERKQIGTLESLDETVSKREFDDLEERVILLETKIA